MRSLCALPLLAWAVASGQGAPGFKVLGFATSKDDAGHVVYEREANRWLPRMGALHGFHYDSTRNWSDCNSAKLAGYQVVIVFDERPEDKNQRAAIEKYVKGGGGFIASHGAAFAMNGSQQPMNWSWYHDTLFGSGEYRSNTWRPTSAFLKREDSTHPFMAGMPPLFKSAPNEWYRWKGDLKAKKDIRILLSIDPSSFPLGTGPKPEEIWHEGWYPVAWTNVKYNMLYVNMGHNDINSPGTGKDSETFANEVQNRLFLNALLKLGRGEASSLRQPAAARAGTAPTLRRQGAQTLIEAADGREFELRGRESPAGKVSP